jgi:3-hydroxy acid dehydrogenase/malonic semialdehyde reductase
MEWARESNPMHKKKIALVTGASSGIGKALVNELVSQGWVVFGLARSEKKLGEIKNKVGSLFIPMTCDVSNQSDVTRVCQDIVDQGLCPTVFFLNAGLAGNQVIENPKSFKIDMHERIMAVNYFGVLKCVECFEKPCQKNGGAHFIVTGSVNAIFAPPTGSAYSASKAAISKAFESLSLTYFGKNLRFSSIYTGPVATDGLVGRFPFTWSAEKMAKYMVWFSERNKKTGYPSLFYTTIAHLFRIFPDSLVMFILKKI